MDIYVQILAKIKKDNLTQKDIAKKISIKQGTVSNNLKSIKNKSCSLATLNKYCSILNLDLCCIEKN